MMPRLTRFLLFCLALSAPAGAMGQAEPSWAEVAQGSLGAADVERTLTKLLALLQPDERARVGQVGVRLLETAEKDDGCTQTLRLAYLKPVKAGVHELRVCADAIRAFYDVATVAQHYPFAIQNMEYAEIIQQGEPIITYQIELLATVERQTDAKGRIAFPLRHCTPYLYLEMVAQGPARQACRAGSETEARQAVRARAAKSTLLDFLVKSIADAGPDAGDVSALEMLDLMTIVYRQASLDFVVAHELSHLTCRAETSACDDEAAIDKIAIDLLLRDEGGLGAVTNFQAIVDALAFTSLFNDWDTIHRLSLETTLMRREIFRRRGLASCLWLDAFDKVYQAEADVFRRLEEATKKTNPAFGAAFQDRFIGIRIQMQFQCGLAQQAPS